MSKHVWRNKVQKYWINDNFRDSVSGICVMFIENGTATFVYLFVCCFNLQNNWCCKIAVSINVALRTKPLICSNKERHSKKKILPTNFNFIGHVEELVSLTIQNHVAYIRRRRRMPYALNKKINSFQIVYWPLKYGQLIVHHAHRRAAAQHKRTALLIIIRNLLINSQPTQYYNIHRTHIYIAYMYNWYLYNLFSRIGSMILELKNVELWNRWNERFFFVRFPFFFFFYF